MATQSGEKSSDLAEEEAKADVGGQKPALSAAQEELGILERLARSVWSVISEYSKRPTFDGRTGEVELSLHDIRQSTLKGYEELAHHCYGRTAAGKEIDESGRKLHDFTYRITQANVGETSCGILARNSPLASKLVTAQHGEEAEVPVPRGMRYFQVAEVRTFDGPSSLLSPSREPDFRLMMLHQSGRDRPLLVKNLRSFVRRLQGADLQTGSETGPPQSIQAAQAERQPQLGRRTDSLERIPVDFTHSLHA